MLMKIFNKGQIVIPAEIRNCLGFNIGDKLEFHIDKTKKQIRITKPSCNARKLAGSFHSYVKSKKFPSKKWMKNTLIEGLTKKYEN